MPTFDADRFFHELDGLLDSQQPTEVIEAFFDRTRKSIGEPPSHENQLTVLNEEMGFYRSRSMHAQSTAAARKALTLLETSDGITDVITKEIMVTTLINAATAYRAAHDYETSLPLYLQALEKINSKEISSEEINSPDASLPTRTLASLHNNLSILYSDTGRTQDALLELTEALRILESEKDPNTASSLAEEIGSTHSNMALVLLELGRTAEAAAHAQKAYDVYIAHNFDTTTAHFASILSTLAQCEALTGNIESAREHYTKALGIIESAYGTASDQYAVVDANLAILPLPSDYSGLEISRQYWERYGKPMLHEKYPQLEPRIAAGLVGHGSERYGFDDDLSRDHDFAPGFCLWLTSEDNAQFGKQLQHDYDSLPRDFMGLNADASTQTPRSQGTQRRVGVFSIPEFFESITGLASSPSTSTTDNLLWLSLDEPTLAAATNGEVFADPLGEFSSVRQGFKRMPDDVRLSLISRRLGMIAQAGQYNFPRMLARHDTQAAQLCLSEFAQAAISLVFLINTPMIAGYMPYYKWQFAALRKLSKRMGMRLPGVCEPLERAMDSGTRDPEQTQKSIALVARLIVGELQSEGLTRISDDFLEWHRPYVEEQIADARLRSL